MSKKNWEKKFDEEFIILKGFTKSHSAIGVTDDPMPDQRENVKHFIKNTLSAQKKATLKEIEKLRKPELFDESEYDKKWDSDYNQALQDFLTTLKKKPL